MRLLGASMLALSTFALAACAPRAGTGAHHAGALPPTASATRSATFVLRVPRKATAATARRPAYVPASIRSARVTANPGGATTDLAFVPGSAACPLSNDGVNYVCTATVGLAVTTTSVVFAAYDTAISGTTIPLGAAVLAAGTVPVSTSADTANVTVPLVLGGVPAYAEATAGGTLAAAATTAGSVQATVNVHDATGAILIGTGGLVSASGAPLTLALTAPSSQSDVTFAVPARSIAAATAIAVQPGDVVNVAVAGNGAPRTGVIGTISANDGATTTRLGFLRAPADTSSLTAATTGNAGFSTFGGIAGVPPDAAAGGGAYGDGVVLTVGGIQLYRVHVAGGGSVTIEFCTPSGSSLGAVAVGPGGIGYAHNGTALARMPLAKLNSGGSSCGEQGVADVGSDLGGPYSLTDLAADGVDFYGLATFGGTHASEFGLTATQGGTKIGYVSDGDASTPIPGFTSVAGANGNAFWVGSAKHAVYRRGAGALTSATAGVTTPGALAQDDAGTAYVLDGSSIDRCDVRTATISCAPWTTAPAGVIGGPHPLAVGADGALWVATSSSLVRIDPATTAQAPHALAFAPQFIAASGDGKIYAAGAGRVMMFP